MYRVPDAEFTTFRKVIVRPDKEPLVATFGGMSPSKNPDGMGMDDFDSQAAWNYPAGNRPEVVQHLLHKGCLLCGEVGPVQMHHIRKLSDIDRPGRRPKEQWEKIMAARRRKMIPVCGRCHGHIHAGRYDGQKFSG